MSNELYHHGIFGMKWGVRRFQNEDGTRTAAGKKRRKETASRGSSSNKRQNAKTSGKKIRNRTVSEMSDQELNDRLNRLRKESEYKRLTEPMWSRAGKKVLQAVLVTAALEVGKNLATGYIKLGIDSIRSFISEARGIPVREILDVGIKQ